MDVLVEKVPEKLFLMPPCRRRCAGDCLSPSDTKRHRTEDEAASLSECNLYWMVNRVERSGNAVTVRLSQRCGATTREYLAELDREEWRVELRGVGSGFAERPVGCPCVP